MKKMIFASVVACVLSLTSCSFIPNTQNSQDSISSPDSISMESEPEAVVLSGEEYATEAKKRVSENDFSASREQYASRIDTCLQTMQKTISSNFIPTGNALSASDPFWSAIAEKSSAIDVNPIEVMEAVPILLSATGNSAYKSDFIPFIYEPVFGNTDSYSKLKPNQILAVIAEKTFGVSSKSVNVGYLESQNLYCTYVISDKNHDYAIVCALYAYVSNGSITKLGVETFARSYSGTYASDGCMGSICNISCIPAKGSFNDSFIVPEHKTMCDIAATVMSKGYYYQRSSASFISVNDGSSYLDNCCHICAAHYVSWFYLT